MKVQVSHRLDGELLAWATEYGESRRVSRAVVIESALDHFKALTSGGVPDLVEPEPAPKPPAMPATSPRRTIAQEMGWAP